MKPKKITEGVYWVGAQDWDRRLFDSLVPLPEGTSYNAYLVKGSEKTALLDTVDPSKTEEMLRHLEGVDRLDCIVAHHAEQDHSGAIPVIMERYPDSVVYATPKGKVYLIDHLHIDPERVVEVADGETLSLGDRTLEFIHAPWVHWPETMLTYLREDRILFTCDLFGSHMASSSLFAIDMAKVCEEAKRYYAEVMMPFRLNIRKHMARIDGYDIDMIAPSHGPVFNDPACILASYRDWVSDDVRNTVIIPYASMHGSTELMVDHLTEALDDRGIHVERFNLTVTDIGRLAMTLVDAATMVVGSPTVLLGAHPIVVSAAFLANALRPKLKYASIIGSYGWGGRMVDQIKGVTPNLKVELLEPVLVKGRPREADLKALDKLADGIAEKHSEGGVLPWGESGAHVCGPKPCD